MECIQSVDLENVKSKFLDAMTTICCENLPFTTDLHIEGLIGITVDQKRIFLVNIQSDCLAEKHDSNVGFVSPNATETNLDVGIDHSNNSGQSMPMTTSPSRKNKRKARPVRAEQSMSSEIISKKPCLSIDDDDSELTSLINDEPHTLTSDPVYGQAAIPISHLSTNITEPALDNVFTNISKKILSSYEETEEIGLMCHKNNKTLKKSQDTLTHIKHPIASKPQSLYIDKPTPSNQRLKRHKPRGFYTTYTKEMRHEIGEYAMMNGIVQTVRHYTQKFGYKIGESTVRSMRKQYLQSYQLNGCSQQPQQHGTTKKGRESCLQQYEPIVRKQLKELLKTQPTTNSRLVIEISKSILEENGKSNWLKENGGHLELTKSWADSFLSSVRSPPINSFHTLNC